MAKFWSYAYEYLYTRSWHNYKTNPGVYLPPSLIPTVHVPRRILNKATDNINTCVDHYSGTYRTYQPRQIVTETSIINELTEKLKLILSFNLPQTESLINDKLIHTPRKKFYLNLRNRFLTPFLQFEVKTSLEETSICLILSNHVFRFFFKWKKNYVISFVTTMFTPHTCKLFILCASGA